MNPLLILALACGWVAILPGCWLGWQLLRQNGRILLRLDELEKRLNELEFGDADEPEGLPLGSEAPAFELLDLSGERKSLVQFRGQPVLLIFFNPDCGFCREMMPQLATLTRPADTLSHPTGEGRGEGPPLSLILTTGDAEKNRQLFAEHQVNCPVLLQQEGEVAKAYQALGTPSGYLINAEGKIASQLAMGAEALLKLAIDPHPQPLSMGEGGQGPGEDDRANRFNNRSLSNSKLKRDGLKAGTFAPDFRLPTLDGKGELSLSEFRGKRVLLVFSNPGCGPCDALAPVLEKFHRAHHATARTNITSGYRSEPLAPSLSPSDGERVAEGRVRGITVVMISKGEPKENRAKVKEHGLTFPIVLQQQWEISRRYALFATPIAYLIDEQGVILKDVAVGVEPIQALMAETWYRSDWSE